MRVVLLQLTLLVVSFVSKASGLSATEPATEADESIRTLISDLVSAKWGKVRRAEMQLESIEAAGIPALIKLLDRDDVVPLTDTADLIYPGAKEFYGHGRIVDYDLDRIAVRAGWALEETTFKDFGFSEGAIREADLLQATAKGKRDVPLKDVVPAKRNAALRDERLKKACKRVKEWWAAEGDNWSRYKGLKEALTSNETSRQMNALGWLRHDPTECKGLTPETYDRDLLPIVRSLAKSGNEQVRDQATLLAGDRERWWWKWKTDKSLR